VTERYDTRVLYSSVIHERFRRPRFRGELTEPDAAFEDVNPLCGDRIRMELRVADSTIGEARFRGDSCAICTASADILAEMVHGQTFAQAEAVTVGDLLARLEADIRPSRMKCVALPLQVLKRALAPAGVRS
jgi:nitrogen fixation NifU-like protein